MVKKHFPQVSVRGLVKAMNIARRNLEEHSRRGLSAAELEAFDNWVRNIVRQTEEICWRNEIKPDQLPAPSFRAYVFLKSLNIQELDPADNATDGLEAQEKLRQGIDSTATRELSGNSEKSAVPARRQVRVANLIKICGHLQVRIAEAASKISGKGEVKTDAIRGLLSDFQETARQVEQICHEEGGSPSDLPAPSRRAYQWVKFLSEQGYLEMHLNALRLALKAVGNKPKQKTVCRKELPAGFRNLPVHFEFFNLPAIYRMKPGKESIQIIASEGFINAPPEVIEALVCMALLRKRGAYQTRVQNFADSEEFSEILLSMELTIEDSNEATRGQVYDLDAIFQRVNAQYFQGQLERPRLTWNQTLTHHKFGHYQPTTDTLMVSITLDHPEIPIYLLEFVMYHELLHKALGLKISNGRRYAHHKDFLEAEARFQHYTEAKEWLSRLGDRGSRQ